MSVKPVVMVGAFPPPVHGMSAVNAAVREQLCQYEASPIVIDTAAKNLDRSILSRFSRLPKIVTGLIRLATTLHIAQGSFYMSVSGGFGQIYEIAFVWVARLKGLNIYLHHHSYAYLRNKNRMTSMLITSAGPNATHITQCKRMASRLQELYPVATTVAPVSNTVFMPLNAITERKPPEKLSTVGFISNVCREKGIFEFLEIIESPEAEKLDLRAKIAGPFQDSETEQKVRARLAKCRRADYVGPKYGEEKNKFFSSIDVLIFPTVYDNETEGIVNHESMSHGIPVITYGRGCIPEIVKDDWGLVIEPGQKFSPAALDKLQYWSENHDEYLLACRRARQNFDDSKTENQSRWKILLEQITGKQPTQ